MDVEVKSHATKVLSELGEEVKRLERRMQAIKALTDSLDHNFTAAEIQTLEQKHSDVSALYIKKKNQFRTKFQIYDTKIKSICSQLGQRAKIVDTLCSKNEALRDNLDLIHIFQTHHDALVSDMKKSRKEIEHD